MLLGVVLDPYDKHAGLETLHNCAGDICQHQLPDYHVCTVKHQPREPWGLEV